MKTLKIILSGNCNFECTKRGSRLKCGISSILISMGVNRVPFINSLLFISFQMYTYGGESRVQG